MREVPSHGIEARRWTVVFHRKAENWFFDLIAMGEFKHVSAFAWLPEFGLWVFYDVGFRRTRIMHMAEGVAAHATIAAIVDGNCTVTFDARNENLPLFRLGFFCTTAVKHLIGVRSSALRPSALIRHLVAQGGVIRDDGSREAADSAGSEPCSRTGAGAGLADQEPAERSPA